MAQLGMMSRNMAPLLRNTALLGAFVASSCHAASSSLPTPASVLQAAALADSYWNANNAPGDCGWTRGTLFAGKTAYYNITQDRAGEREFNERRRGACDMSYGNPLLPAEYIANWSSAQHWTCGGPGSSALDPNNFACGMSYAAQYELQPANYKLALLVSLQQAIAQSPLYAWYWVDTFFMALGTWVRYACARRCTPVMISC